MKTHSKHGFCYSYLTEKAPIIRRYGVCLARMSAAGQIFAPAKSAFTPSLAFELPSSSHGWVYSVPRQTHPTPLTKLNDFSVERSSFLYNTVKHYIH